MQIFCLVRRRCLFRLSGEVVCESVGAVSDRVLKSMGSTLSKWSKDLDAYDKQAKQMRREDRLGEVGYSAQEDLTSKTSKQNEDELREQ